MLFLFTAVNVLQRVVAAPIQTSLTIEHRSLFSQPTCTDLGSCRTLWEIIWSCLVTIFACTWVAVHPNVPWYKPGQDSSSRWYSGALRRAYIMFYAVIGPEFVIFWAWRQRCAANRKSVVLEDWSLVHGFFAVMGGFVSHDGKKRLSLEDIETLVLRKEIEYPIVTRDEIKDRSKGDAVTKALVVLQTTWFLLQCAARAKQRLALSELELATAAFALLNIITYVIWWDKPLDVECPVRVRRAFTSTKEKEDRHVHIVDGVGSGSSDGAMKTGKKRECCGWPWSCVDPVQAVRNLIRPFRSMLDRDDESIFSVLGEHTSDWGHSSFYGAIFVTMSFGGIHCIGWSFHFPSYAERLLWRISSIAITGIPLVYTGIGFIDEKYHNVPWRFLALLLIFYVIVRVLLLVLSLTTLRSLPPSILQTVEWTTFLPHI